MKRIIPVCFVFLTGSCSAVQSIDPELRRRAASIEILTMDAIGERSYNIINEVLGVSCARQTGTDPSLEGARQDMRIEAARLGADAVTSEFCRRSQIAEEGGFDMKRNCWKTFQCRGDAIAWQ